VVEHAELRWPSGGGVMFGTSGKDQSPFGQRAPGNDAVYVVCDEPDGLLVQAITAGAEVVRDLADEDYGSRGFTVRDPEGNLWSFGTYHGAAADTHTVPAKDVYGAMLDAWASAIVADDADAIASFITDDWVLVTPQAGVVPGARFLDAVRSGRLSHDTMQLQVVRARVHDGVAVVTTRGTNSGVFDGAPFSADEWATNVFVPRAGGWRCVLTQLTPVGAPR
jgi:ketosteroid isomerase-like protein